MINLEDRSAFTNVQSVTIQMQHSLSHLKTDELKGKPVTPSLSYKMCENCDADCASYFHLIGLETTILSSDYLLPPSQSNHLCMWLLSAHIHSQPVWSHRGLIGRVFIGLSGCLWVSLRECTLTTTPHIDTNLFRPEMKPLFGCGLCVKAKRLRLSLHMWKELHFTLQRGMTSPHTDEHPKALNQTHSGRHQTTRIHSPCIFGTF